MNAIERAFLLKLYCVLAALIFFAVVAVFPVTAHAQWQTEADIAAEIAAQTAIQIAPGLAADAMCTPFVLGCPCGKVPSNTGCVPGANMNSCYCFDVTNGYLTNGVCVAEKKCKAVPASGGSFGTVSSGSFGSGGGLLGGFNPTQTLLGMGAQMLMSQL